MRLPSLVATAAAALALSACGSASTHSASPASTGASQPPSGAAVAHGRAKVAIQSFAFAPATVTVAPGTRIVFTNHDATAHTATSTSRAFDTGSIADGHSRAVTLAKAGTYTYYCQFHAFMKGTIVVR